MIEPYSFIKTVPNGLFFLKKYNPNKKIVLFVHGINGSPRNFKYIIKNLDTSKYQPLVYYYPSGLSLKNAGEHLKIGLEELKIIYGFKSISLVAHSMGGLVSRYFLNRLIEEDNNYIDTFITISTPWEGHRGATYGIKYSPLVLPVWNDIEPNSEFIKNLFKTELPKTTRYYLLFSYKGKRIIGGENNDGVVSIKSQLRYDAQLQSTITRGFNEEHMSILSNKEVSKLINTILNKNQ
jgi:triacylglycerol esterase/lipase EstA (alpha/beta hydrolase family)